MQGMVGQILMGQGAAGPALAQPPGNKVAVKEDQDMDEDLLVRVVLYVVGFILTYLWDRIRPRRRNDWSRAPLWK